MINFEITKNCPMIVGAYKKIDNLTNVRPSVSQVDELSNEPSIYGNILK